jgi:hypothetical protein
MKRLENPGDLSMTKRDGDKLRKMQENQDDALDRAYQSRDDWKAESERLKEQLKAAHYEGFDAQHWHAEYVATWTAWSNCVHRITSLRHALETVRAECDLPEYIAEFIGDALATSNERGLT